MTFPARDLVNPPEPYLYILMRSDLDSLNPGKMVAQGAHAANQFAFEMVKVRQSINRLKELEADLDRNELRKLALFNQWETSTPQGFGVTITLDVTGTILPLVVEAAQRMDLPAGVTHDPSYPIRDGEITHLIPLDTCGYVFGDKDELRVLLGQFDLLA